MSANSNTFTGDKVPVLTRILFPWSGIFRDACYALVGTFLIQFALTAGVLSTDASTFTAQYGVITTAMFIALLWDGINDPIMGFILEKCHFKAGKFRPWIALGAIGNAIVVALMFLMPMLIPGLRGWGYVAFMIVMYILWDTCFTMNDIGYWSMLPALTNDPKTRATLTSHTAIAASVGTFMMNIMMFLLPGLIRLSTMQIYAITGSGIAALFLVSQLIVFFLCKEKQRDAKQDEVSENSSILDLFRVVAKNKQLLVCAISMFLYYFASFILTGIGQNYFYIVYGYGGGKGGMVATAISAFYIIGTVAAQAFFPMLAKKLSKKKILTIAGAVTAVAYLAFFFTAFPVFGDKPLAWATPNADNMFWVFGGTMSILYVLSIIFFGASGIFYLTILVMFQDAIDYGEWKNGERKESICFAWRPLDVKVASGFNRLLQFLVFAVTGTAAAINAIGTAEGQYYSDLANVNNLTPEQAAEATRDATTVRDASIAGEIAKVERWQLILFGVIIIGTIIVLFAAAYILINRFYKIDEETEKKIVAELEVRHQEDARLAAEAAGEAAAPETPSGE